jgi:hypothetical protein
VKATPHKDNHPGAGQMSKATDGRNVASQIAFEVSDRRARGPVGTTGPDSFLPSVMNAQAEGGGCGEEVSVGGPAFVF